MARLERGPIAFPSLSPRIAQAIQQRAATGQTVEVGAAAIEKGEHGPALSIDGITLKDATGAVVLSAPKAVVLLDPVALLAGSFTPKRVDIVGLTVRLSITANGSIAISAGDRPVVLGELAARMGQAADERPADAAVATAPGAQAGGVPLTEAPASAATAEGSRAAMRPIAAALMEAVRLSTSEQSPLGLLTQAGLRQGRLVFEDESRGTTTSFDDLEIVLTRNGGEAVLNVSANGPRGRWTMEIGASSAGEGYGKATQLVNVRIANLSFDDVAMAAGFRNPPAQFSSPISLELQLGASGDGEFRLARGRASLGRGNLLFADGKAAPVAIEAAGASFQWDDERSRIVIEDAQFRGKDFFAAAKGEILPPTAQPGSGWRFDLTSTRPLQPPGGPDAKAPEIEQATLSGEFDRLAGTVKGLSLRLGGPQTNVQIEGQLAFLPGERAIDMTVNATDTPVRTILGLWPAMVAPDLRGWLHGHLLAGKLEHGRLRIRFDEADIKLIEARQPLPADHIQGEYRISGATLKWMEGAPALRGVRGYSTFDAHTSQFTAESGYLESARQKIDLSGGKFTSRMTQPGVFAAQVNARLSGAVDTLARALTEPGLKPHAAIQLDPSALKGRFDGQLDVTFRFGDHAGPLRPVFKADVNATQLTIEKLFGKEKLENGTLKVSVTGNEVSGRGSGRIFGAPATISFDRKGRSEIAGVISAVLDDEARRKMGWSLPQVQGPVGIKMTGPLGVASPKGSIEIDLTKAAIANVPAPLAKPPGRIAKASFTLAPRGNGSSLQNFSYQSGPSSARGAIEFDRNGQFVSASLSSLKLSPGDDMRAEVRNASGRLQVTARGATIDMRPHLPTKSGSSPGKNPRKEDARGIDLDVEAKLATGHNGQIISNFKLRVSQTGAQLRSLEFSGNSGRAGLRGEMKSQHRLEVVSDDGGALLSFMDIYRRMEGGRLRLIADLSATSASGVLQVGNFIIRNEPALRRLVLEGVVRRDAQGREKLDLSSVEFSRLQFAFVRNQSRFHIRDGVISGPAVGATLAGTVDFSRNAVNMQGTFVPAYGLNNMFSNIPLFGPILGGGKNEGLLAVNFRVTGAASSPYLTINPLSAIAPGFLRKIFGAAAIQPDTTGGGGATGSTQPAEAPAPARRGPINLAPQR